MCVYDAWNRLVAVGAPDSEDPGQVVPLASYEYDGRGMRVRKYLALDEEAEEVAAEPPGSVPFAWCGRGSLWEGFAEQVQLPRRP